MFYTVASIFKVQMWQQSVSPLLRPRSYRVSTILWPLRLTRSDHNHKIVQRSIILTKRCILQHRARCVTNACFFNTCPSVPWSVTNSLDKLITAQFVNIFYGIHTVHYRAHNSPRLVLSVGHIQCVPKYPVPLIFFLVVAFPLRLDRPSLLFPLTF